MPPLRRASNMLSLAMPDALPKAVIAPPSQLGGASGSPIVVSATPAPDQLVVALRQLFTVLGTSATALGATHLGSWLGQAAVVVGPLVTVAVLVMGQLHQRHQSTKLAAMANALPDAVAVVK